MTLHEAPVCTPADLALVEVAAAARMSAYAPYSKFPVGAAVRAETGAVFGGFNIENSAYGHAMCAERVALFSAMAVGSTGFTDIAVVADLAVPIAPCGACRQVMAELAPQARVIMANLQGEVRAAKVAELLPYTFALGAEMRSSRE